MIDLVKKYPQHYKKFILIDYIIGIISLACFLIGLKLKLMFVFWVGIVLFGASIYTVLPGVIEYACESMHPIGEATVTGLLFGFGELFSFGIVIY